MAWPADFPPVEGFDWTKRENVRALVAAVAERVCVPDGASWPPEWADPAADADWNLQRAYWAYWDPAAGGGAGDWTDPDSYANVFTASTVNWRLLQYQLVVAVSKGYVEAKDWSGYTAATIPTLTWYDVCVLAGLYRAVFATTCTGVYDPIDDDTALTFSDTGYPDGYQQDWMDGWSITIAGYGGNHTLDLAAGIFYVPGDCSGIGLACSLEQYGFRRAIVEPPAGATITHPAFLLPPHNGYMTHNIGAMRPQVMLSRVDDLDPETWYCLTPGDPDPSDKIGLWIFQDIYAVCNVLKHTKHTSAWESLGANRHGGSSAGQATLALAHTAAEANWDLMAKDGPTGESPRASAAHYSAGAGGPPYGGVLYNRWQEYQETESGVAIWPARTVDVHWYGFATRYGNPGLPPIAPLNFFGNSKFLLQDAWSKWLVDEAATREVDDSFHSTDGQGNVDVKPTWSEVEPGPWDTVGLGYQVVTQTAIINWAREGGFDYYA